MKDLILSALLLESFETAIELRKALIAAAKLLRHCNCQRFRARESIAALNMATKAMDRLDALNSKILQSVPVIPHNGEKLQ